MATAHQGEIPTPQGVKPVSRLPLNWTLPLIEQHLGVAAGRIRLSPTPGTATERDLLDLERHGNVLCELIDGVLVEKSIGWYESTIAQILGGMLQEYLRQNPLGLGLGADAAVKLLDGQIRMPDVCFVDRQRVQRAKPQRGAVPTLVPNLAVEILSKSNTEQEMQRKITDYFAAGVERVWLIDRPSQSARAYSSAEAFEPVPPDGTLTAENILPGFAVSLSDLFARADAQAGL